MYKINNNYTSSLNSLRLQQLLTRYFVLFILTVVFANQTYAVQASSPITQFSANFKAKHTYLTKIHRYNPVKSSPDPYEQQESIEELEVSEDLNDSFNSLNLSVLRLDFSLLAFTVQNRYYQLKQSYQKRPAVALFILHHSWKSFL